MKITVEIPEGKYCNENSGQWCYFWQNGEYCNFYEDDIPYEDAEIERKLGKSMLNKKCPECLKACEESDGNE